MAAPTMTAEEIRRQGFEIVGDRLVRVGQPDARPTLESWTDAEGQLCYRFTLYSDCPPRTKKNSNQAARTGPKCPACGLGKGPARVFPSVSFRAYQAGVVKYLKDKPELRLQIVRPMSMLALVYRDANRGDYFGFMQALGDVLQHCGVIANDGLIQHTDGSRLRKDAMNPRVEITLTILKADVQEELL